MRSLSHWSLWTYQGIRPECTQNQINKIWSITKTHYQARTLIGDVSSKFLHSASSTSSTLLLEQRKATTHVGQLPKEEIKLFWDHVARTQTCLTTHLIDYNRTRWQKFYASGNHQIIAYVMGSWWNESHYETRQTGPSSGRRQTHNISRGRDNKASIRWRAISW